MGKSSQEPATEARLRADKFSGMEDVVEAARKRIHQIEVENEERKGQLLSKIRDGGIRDGLEEALRR